MNIKIPYHWLKEYVQVKEPAEKLAARLSLAGPSVERVYPLAEINESLIAGKILKISNHPNADKLKLCKVDIGKKDPVQVVCGGVNIYEGMIGIMALPGTMVRWHGKGDPVKLEPAVIRGEKSFGMLCAASEVGLGNIFEEKPITVVDLTFAKMKSGSSIAKALKLNDAVFDIEVTSNRPDMMSVVGLAREASVITGAKFLYKDPRPIKATGQALELKVENKAPKLCSRYCSLIMDEIQVKPSPWWLQQRLIAAGLRPINNIVDITNYVLLEYGQPMHAFDWEKLEGNQIIVREAKSGEKILALDGQEYKLIPKDLVIADAKKPVAVAGVMGGEVTAVSDKTTRIVLEGATFNPYSVRKTARRLNLYSESQALFEKGLNPVNAENAIWRAAELVQKLAGGKVVSPLADKGTKKLKPSTAALNLDQVERFLGVEIPVAKIKSILTSLGFKTQANKSNKKIRIKALVPWWREGEVAMDQDLIEEIARIYGYHNLPSELPTGELPVSAPDMNLFWEEKAKDILVGAGMTEIYSYSFTNESELKKIGIKPENCLRISNPLSEEWTHLRLNLVPSLLSTIEANQALKDSFQLFELANVYIKNPASPFDSPRFGEAGKLKASLGGPGDLLPEERLKLCGAVVGVKDSKVFKKAKGILELLFEKQGIKNAEFKILPAHSKIWQLGKTASIEVAGKTLGQVGIINGETLANFGLKKQVALFNLDFPRLVEASSLNKNYEPIARFPSIDLDLSVLVEKKVLWQNIKEEIQGLGNELIKEITFLDHYEGRGIAPDKKSLAFRIIYRAEDKTLQLQDAQVAHNYVIKRLKEKFVVEVRS